jgi:hypothetical protein
MAGEAGNGKLLAAWEHPKWEKTKPATGRGVRALRLCGNPDRNHGEEHWPRVVILDLTEKQFREFEKNPKKFAEHHKLYPDQPIRWMSHCAKPPLGEGIPQPATSWTAMIIHGKPSIGVAGAVPQESTP